MRELILETIAPLIIMMGVALVMTYLILIDGLEKLNNDNDDKWEAT